MNELPVVVIAVCGLSLACIGLLVAGAFFLARFVGINFLDRMGSISEIFGAGHADTVPTSGSPGAERRRRRSLSASQSSDPLDFDAALARHRSDQTPAVIQPNPPEPHTPGLHAESFDVKTSSPIQGRIMRDGRFRRVTGGTPGRYRAGNFKRAEGGGEPPAATRPETNIEPHIPDTNSPLRRRRRDRNQDEVFGGMMDEDGDGMIDF